MKKKEQFSIALWDRLKKDNIPHTFETRNGVIVNQVTLINRAIDQTIIGYDTVDNSIERWDVNGFYNIKNRLSGVDLFIVWEEEQLMLEGWLYIYVDNSANFLKKPLVNPSEDVVAIVPVSIPYTKGEGLNNPKSN